MEKKLVDEKATRHDGNRGTIPTPCGRGSSCASEASYKCRGGVHTRHLSWHLTPHPVATLLPSPARGEGACHSKSDTPQSLLNSNHSTHFTHFTHFKKAAFTLAETLITLGVIGIVAAMTIPTLISSYQEKVTITKVKKMYSTLSNAYELYKIENGDPGFITMNETGALQLAEIFKPYLKIAKDCGTRGKGCVNGSKISKDGSLNNANYQDDPGYYTLILNDGAQLVLRGGEDSHDFEILYDTNYNNNVMHIANDLFEFDGYDGKIIPNGIENENYKNCPKDTAGWSCTAWIVKFGNMDYLHCPEILDGETKTSCN